MAASKLIEKRVEKVWGRRDLPEMFGGAYFGEQPLGEIWFEDPRCPDRVLLIKYLFTSDKLSIQVHPGHEAAVREGHRFGKDEAWAILEAEPSATIGLGLRHCVSRAELRAAALDGSIEELVNWQPAATGDFFYSPAGTVHALGPGLTLIEIQQNVDVTYRLYDYGRPRELHLDRGIEASHPAPYQNIGGLKARTSGREILVQGGAFVVERWSDECQGSVLASEDHPIWLVPARGGGTIAGEPLEAGSVWLVDEEIILTLTHGAELFIAYPGAESLDGLLR